VVFDLGDVVLKRTNALPSLSSLMVAEHEGFVDAYFRHRRDYDRYSDATAFWTSISVSTRSNAPDPTLIEELVRLDDIGWNDVAPTRRS
jgi:putative hydrolase of the HAD superfamily